MLHPTEQGERKSVSQEWTADVFSTIEKEHTDPAGDGVDESFTMTPFPGSAGCERSTGGEGGRGCHTLGSPSWRATERAGQVPDNKGGQT